MSSKRSRDQCDTESKDLEHTKVKKTCHNSHNSPSRHSVVSTSSERTSTRAPSLPLYRKHESSAPLINRTRLYSNPHHFSGKFPFFREPRELGCFSIDSEMKFVNNSSQKKYYKPPPNPESVSFDLRAGFKTWIKKDDSIKVFLDDMLRWVQCNEHTFLPQGVKNTDAGLFTDFICWRGLLTRILCSPYENREGWIIAVSRHKNTFYMCEFDTEEKIKQRDSETEQQKEMCYGGYKFEQYLCAAEMNSSPNLTEPVNSVEQFGVVVRGRLESHSLVYGGEVDCSDTREKSSKYIELKTSREIMHPNQERSFKRYKLIKWWAQSFLIGIPEIVCGFRDDDGIVHRLQTFKTLQIPKYCQDIGNCWKPEVCFNFLNKFLQLIKDTVTEDNPRISYVFRWEPRQEVTWSLHGVPSPFLFLPEWFYSDNSQAK